MISWLQGNPLGTVLAALCGLLVLACVALGLAWSLPPSSGGEIATGVEERPVELPSQIAPMQPIENFSVVLERPVFNDSRRPEAESGESVEEVVMEPDEQVSDPGVRLTGVVLTPDQKIVTLTPSNSGEPLIVREGTELEGEQLGWAVSSIDPRQVTLSSRDGQELRLELAIHDQMIEEPPKPEPPPMTTEEAQEAAQGEEEGEPLSRAEEIRQRIQERREQLRREAEEAEGEDSEAREEQRTSYQDAIRTMMSRRNNQQEEDSGESEQE